MKILITGAGGYIGSATLSLLRNMRINALPLSSSLSKDSAHLDLMHPQAFDSSLICTGDVILFAAAISSPDICASEPERVRKVNVLGAIEFISTCISKGAKIVFFSSDTVYGENGKDFDETADCNPAGDYAEMKHDVENHFLGNPAFKTIRLSYVFSNEDKFTKYLRACAEREEEAEIFHPFCRAVVHRDDVIQGAVALALGWEEFPQSVINFGGPDVISRIDFSESLKNVALPKLRFRQIEPAADFFTNRPRVIQMRSPLLASLLGRPARTLSEAIEFEFNRDGK